MKRASNMTDSHSVLIIGAGIAGSACAWHLRRRCGNPLHIKVLETNDQPGGRVRRVSCGGEEVEAGATLIHSSNQCLEEFREHLGLERVEPHGRDGRDSVVALWDGSKERFRTGGSLMTALSLLRRYGFAPARAGRVIRKTVTGWESVYNVLRSGAGFPGTRDLFQALQLTAACTTSAYAFFSDAGIGERFVYEFVDGVSRINYGQCGEMNAFASQVSLAGAGMAGGELFSIDGGNAQLCSGLLADAEVDLQLSTAVQTIRQTDHGWNVQDAYGKEHHAAVLILACPPDFIPSLADALPSSQHAARCWQTTHATFICGNLQTDSLPGLDLADPPDTLLTPELESLPFTSLGRVGHGRAFNAPIWKLFSREPLEEALIESLFVHVHDKVHLPWRAYPVLSPQHEWPAFRVAEALYDLSAMESVVSTMETQAVSGLNTANLVARTLSAG